MFISALLVVAAALLAAAAPTSSTSSAKRQSNPFVPFLPCEDNIRQKLAGDGDPHQRYKYIQNDFAKSPQNCGRNEGCEIAAQEVEGVSTSWGASVSADGWFGGGFEVTEYSESGELANCNGSKNEKSCFFWRFAHTVYTVQEIEGCDIEDEDKWENKGDPYIIVSPNKDDKGSGWVCGRVDQCKSVGAFFWGNFPKVVQGGPQEFPFKAAIESVNLEPPKNGNEEFSVDAKSKGGGGSRGHAHINPPLHRKVEDD